MIIIGAPTQDNVNAFKNYGIDLVSVCKKESKHGIELIYKYRQEGVIRLIGIDVGGTMRNLSEKEVLEMANAKFIEIFSQKE